MNYGKNEGRREGSSIFVVMGIFIQKRFCGDRKNKN